VIAVTGIHQHDPLGQTRRTRRLDLLEGDLRLALEGDLLRYLGLAPQALILRPILRKIEPISHRKAGITVGQRQGHRHLTVILLPELTAILPGHPDRVPPLLGKTRVVDDPGFDRPATLDHRQHELAHLIEHGRIGPRRIAVDVYINTLCWVCDSVRLEPGRESAGYTTVTGRFARPGCLGSRPPSAASATPPISAALRL